MWLWTCNTRENKQLKIKESVMKRYAVVCEVRRAVHLTRARKCPKVLTIALIAAALPLWLFAEPDFGLVGGVARDAASGKPVCEAEVIIRNLEKSTDRHTFTNSEGYFAFTELEPGQYEVAATKSGFQKSFTRVDVTAHKSTQVDLPLEAVPTDREKALIERLEKLEARLAAIERLEARLTALEGTPANHSVPAPLLRGNETLVASRTEISTPPARVPEPMPVPVSPLPVSSTSQPFSTSQSLSTSQPSSSPPPAADNVTPFGFADFTWLNGNARTKELAFDSKFFTPEIRFDTVYVYDYNHPKDDTIVGSAEIFRSQEFQVTQVGVGGDFHYDNVRGRLMTQLGMYSQTQPRNDPSPARGQWTLDGAYRYLAEAYGGYHFNIQHGVNVDAGIFMSYIGLFSWYNFDNWAYQPSYVSSNTPFFFNGLRVQWFPTNKLKIEPWLINGWQSYGRINGRPGLGFQVLYRPNESVSIVSNGYGIGEDAFGAPGRIRYHSDNSLQVKYYDKPGDFLDKAAFSVTGDIGCEHGGNYQTGAAVSCTGISKKVINGQTYLAPKQSFLGYMFYNRLWFHRDLYALTIGGGQINNPGRYLVLLPPINGATAATGTPYFTENPGDQFKAWDVSGTFDYMPRQYITFRWEYNHRTANVPYFSGQGGVTPPGGNNGNPSAIVPGWSPDLRKIENRINIALLVKF